METTAIEYFLNECKQTKDISLKIKNNIYNLYYKGRLFGCMNGDKFFVINTPSSRWYLGSEAIQYHQAFPDSLIEVDVITISCFIHSMLVDMYDDLLPLPK